MASSSPAPLDPSHNPPQPPTPSPAPAIVSQRLQGSQLAAGQIPARDPVTVRITVMPAQDAARAVLVAYPPPGWALVDNQGGRLVDDDARLRIEWTVLDVRVGVPLMREYVVSSPARSQQPANRGVGALRAAAGSAAAAAGTSARDEFQAFLQTPAGTWESAPEQVTVAPLGTTVDPFLRAADVVVGSTTYNTITTAAPSGPLATAAASLSVRRVDSRFADPSLISTWAFDPVPAGTQWTLANPWNFDIYVRANTSSSVRVLFAAEIYRISTTGQATLLRKTPYSGQVEGLPTASFRRVTWNDTNIPSGLTLGPGERLGIALIAFVDGNEQSGLQTILGFDDTVAPSSVTWSISEQTAPGAIRLSHVRFAEESPLASPAWRGALDSSTGPLLRGESVQAWFQLYNDGGTAASWRPRLEWATSSSGPWSAVPTTLGSAPFALGVTSQFANGDPVAAPALPTRAEAWQNGVAYESINPPMSALSLGAAAYTEIVYSVLVTTNAAQGSQYFLRLSDNGAALPAYAVIGTVTIQSSAVPGATPGGPTPTPQPPAHNLNQPYGPDTAACAGCHRVHTAPGKEALRKAWPEEQLCFTCHDGTGAPNIRAEFQKPYRMPIAQTEYVHRTGEARTGSSFSGAKRHVECEDCHNPHEAGAVSHTLGTAYAAGPQQGVWGVGAAWSSEWTAPTFTVKDRVTYQYELCLKCHSTWAFGANPPTSPTGGFPETDQSVEFNPYNPSYHPVAAVGKNPFVRVGGSSYAGSLLRGLTPASNLVCSDCHGSESQTGPTGPHGSNNPWILRGAWNRTVGTDGNQNALCFSCHAYNVYSSNASRDNPSVTGFSGEGKNLHAAMVGARNKAFGDAPITCMDCHVAIPHGWKRSRLIGFTGDGAPYINRPYSGGLTTIDTWQESGQWTFDSCGTAMDSCK
ncbi:MAG: cytochrome c3 family protein [Chloroflexota bacterium]